MWTLRNASEGEAGGETTGTFTVWHHGGSGIGRHRSRYSELQGYILRLFRGNLFSFDRPAVTGTPQYLHPSLTYNLLLIPPHRCSRGQLMTTLRLHSQLASGEATQYGLFATRAMACDGCKAFSSKEDKARRSLRTLADDRQKRRGQQFLVPPRQDSQGEAS